MREEQKKLRSVLGPSQMAADLGIATAYAWQILEGQRPIQPKHARILSELYPGLICKHSLCPDVFGPPPQDEAA